MHLSARLLVAVSFAVIGVRACGEHDDSTHSREHRNVRREYPQTYLTPPTRPLEWGDLNIIHTTDTHGWLLGHQKGPFPEPNYSGDLGDFSSFVAHMKRTALEKDVDLLLIDSGDLHDGTGLSDGFLPGGVDGHDSNQFLLDLPYDVMAIGNHELYIYANTLDMHTDFAPKLKGRYLTSNVNITVADQHGNNVSVPVGERFTKFKTRKGRKVTSLGVIFDFTGNDVNTTVQKVDDMVKESWFAEAIAEEPDLFLLVGHMPIVKTNDWPLVFNAVRAVHPNTPILILGGHSHIRDCAPYDGRAIAFQSGRYMETVGWLSVNLDQHGPTENLTFSRRYLDANRVSYEFHTTRSNVTFDTPKGRNITAGLHGLAEKFDLEFFFGTAPHDYRLAQAPFPSNNSLVSLFGEAIQYSLVVNNTRADIPHVIIANSGSQRYDVFGGPFTKNDQVTASPFTNAFVYVANVSASAAGKMLSTLNEAGEQDRRRALRGEFDEDGMTPREREAFARGDVDMVFYRWLADMSRAVGRRDADNATLGYVTKDSCPGVGDDIPHTPLTVYTYPDFVGSEVPEEIADDAPVDLVFPDFVQTQILNTLNDLQSDVTYTDDDVHSYTDVLTNAVLGIYAQKYWN